MVYKKQTQAIRCQLERSEQREHSVPIYLTSSYVFDNAEHGRALFAGEMEGNNYGRYSNPNTSEFATKIALLEETEHGVCFATGMAAIFTAIMSHCKSGDKIVASRCLFGSTVQILTKMIPKWGMNATFVDNGATLDAWQKELTDDVAMCIIETPANPTLEIIDISGLAKICRAKKIILMVDNAYATPFLQTPIPLGADLVMHSATKYIDGQGRCLGGVVAGSSAMMEPLEFMLRHAGAAISPFNAWVLSKSLEHLGLRVQKHSDNALIFARYLEQHPKVSKVNYPFLESFPQYDLARQQMSGGGGTLSFSIKSSAKDNAKLRKQAMSVLDALQMCSLSANLGDTRTIVTHPATTTHSSLTEKQRSDMGIDDGLIRVSVGLEDMDDIIADFEEGFDSI